MQSSLFCFCFFVAVALVRGSLIDPVTKNFKCDESGCCDHHEFCRFWAALDECVNNTEWMSGNCQVACETCPFIGEMTVDLETGEREPEEESPAIKWLLGGNINEIHVVGAPAMGPIEGEDEQQNPRKGQEDLSKKNLKKTDKGRNSVESDLKLARVTTVTTTTTTPTPRLKATTTTDTPSTEEPVTEHRFDPSNDLVFLDRVFTRPKTTTEPPETTTETFQTTTVDEEDLDSFEPTVSVTDATTSTQSSTKTTKPTSTTTTKPLPPPKPVEKCTDVKTKQAVETMLVSKLVNPVEDMSRRLVIGVDEIAESAKFSLDQIPKCDRSLCYHLMYRSFDGVCNNLEKPLFGAAFRGFMRLLPPDYDQGDEPKSQNNRTRPEAREANRAILASAQIVTHEELNSMLMQWGQFISHDMARTTLHPFSECRACIPIPSRCMVVKISSKDSNFGFKLKNCQKIPRSAPLCHVRPREQLNENTAFVDASMIYGSSFKDMEKFREGRTAFLRMHLLNNQLLIPWNETKCAQGSGPAECNLLFIAGDIRSNLFIGLGSLHILFTRQHNNIAGALHKLNPHWSGDRVFHEVRKIVGAIVQVILYRDWLPKVLGDKLDELMGDYAGYKPDVNPDISNEFTTAGFRFGHGMLKGGIEPILRGLMASHVKRPHRLSLSLTEKMLNFTDLGMINIQRGRDHGLPSYNAMRGLCGLKIAKKWIDFEGELKDKRQRDLLENNYDHPDFVDLFVGIMLEDPVEGGLVGPTVACIIGDQFRRTRDGDRFYFANPGIFTVEQRLELEKASLSRVICDSGVGVTKVPADAFVVSEEKVKCKDLPGINLKAWKEEIHS